MVVPHLRVRRERHRHSAALEPARRELSPLDVGRGHSRERHAAEGRRRRRRGGGAGGSVPAGLGAELVLFRRRSSSSGDGALGLLLDPSLSPPPSDTDADARATLLLLLLLLLLRHPQLRREPLAASSFLLDRRLFHDSLFSFSNSDRRHQRLEQVPRLVEEGPVVQLARLAAHAARAGRGRRRLELGRVGAEDARLSVRRRRGGGALGDAEADAAARGARDAIEGAGDEH
jgi:hypothetical protein